VPPQPQPSLWNQPRTHGRHPAARSAWRSCLTVTTPSTGYGPLVRLAVRADWARRMPRRRRPRTRSGTIVRVVSTLVPGGRSLRAAGRLVGARPMGQGGGGAGSGHPTAESVPYPVGRRHASASPAKACTTSWSPAGKLAPPSRRGGVVARLHSGTGCGRKESTRTWREPVGEHGGGTASRYGDFRAVPGTPMLLLHGGGRQPRHDDRGWPKGAGAPANRVVARGSAAAHGPLRPMGPWRWDRRPSTTWPPSSASWTWRTPQWSACRSAA